MKKIILAVVIAAGFTAPSFCGEDFNLNSISLSNQEAFPSGYLKASPPAMEKSGDSDKGANLPPAADLSLKLPFATLTRKLAQVGGTAMEMVDPSRPILSRSGDLLLLGNLKFIIDGVEVIPVIQLKPWFEGTNRLAFKIAAIDLDIAFGPDKSRKPIDKNELMASVFEKLAAAIQTAIDKAFAKKNISLKGSDVLSFTYDKLSWTLHIGINPVFIAPLLPGIVKDINLTHFGLSDEGLALSVRSGSAVDLTAVKGYNLALSDGLLTAFVVSYTSGTDFNLLPAGHKGGIRFGQDGVIEAAGTVYARDVFLKPNIYFSAKIMPKVTAENTIELTFQRINLDQAYGINIPGFLNSWLQNKMISTILDTITTNENLAKSMTASKLSKNKVQLTLKDPAMLPSFIQQMSIKGMKVANGVIYLAFDL